MPGKSTLEALFQALHGARNPAEAQRIEEQIWEEWMAPEDPRVADWLTHGMQALRRGEHRAALASFDAVVELAPDFAEGWNKRATVHWLLGNHEASMSDIERTLALEPRHFGALSGLALIHQAQGRVFEALDALERVARIHPHLSDLERRIDALQQGVARAT